MTAILSAPFLADTIERNSNVGAPLMLKIIFWILLILWAVGNFGFHDNPNVVRGTGLVLIILFAILGFYTFGF